MRSIGQLFDHSSSSIYPLLSKTGGNRPPERKRSRLALTLFEREIIWHRSLRPKLCKLAIHKHLQGIISDKLVIHWSPEQITGWLKRQYPNEECNNVSHETIYRSLFVQARGVLKKELQQYLRSRRAIRRSRHATQKGLELRKIKDAVSISERPAWVEDRAVPGHWEGDLIAGSKNSYIATLVERQTRYVMLAKVANKDTNSVVSALIKQAHKLPNELYKSLTWDRGSELASHKRFTLETDIDVYFCDLPPDRQAKRRREGSITMVAWFKRKYQQAS